MNDLPRKLPIWPGAPRASSPRAHVLQRSGGDCAIAAAATIAGVSYDEAASAAFSLREDGLGGMRPERIVKLLYRLTDSPWRIEWRIRSRVQLRAAVFPEQLVVGCISDPWLWRGAHAIVARDRVIYDGSLDGPIHPEDHPRQNWYVSWLIVRSLA